MASIRERSARDGTVRYAVLWREGGRQTSLTLDTERLAEGFKARLELDGAEAAAAWLARQAGAPDATEWTVDAWMDHYITHLTSVTEGTRADYVKLYARTYGKQTVPTEHGGRRLGSMAVDTVNRDKVALATNALAARLKQKSVLNAKGLLFEAFAAAAERDDVPVKKNPVDGIKLPKAGDEEDDTGSKMYLSHAEFAQLYAEIPDHWQPLVLTLVSTGLRWAEATALRRSNYDRAVPSVRVSRAWKKVPGGWELGPPKTKRSRRTVVLPAELVDILDGLVAGRGRDAFLFTTRTRPPRPVKHSNFYTKVWQPAVARADLGRRPRIHDLRHTHVSWLIAEGIQLPVVSRRLGHESIKTTWDVYGDLLPDIQLQAAGAASSALTALRALELQAQSMSASNA